jgi:hypothetical protein
LSEITDSLNQDGRLIEFDLSEISSSNSIRDIDVGTGTEFGVLFTTTNFEVAITISDYIAAYGGLGSLILSEGADLIIEGPSYMEVAEDTM